MSGIHPTAVIGDRVKIADGAVVGAHSVIDGDVEIEAGAEIGPQVCIQGRTRIGARTRIFPFSVIGATPQILAEDRLGGRLEIGADNEIREFASIHVGSPGGGGLTRIGDGNLFQNSVHVAHDCKVGNHCVLAAQSALGGHVSVEDHVVIGAKSGVHQFVRVGESGFSAANSMVSKDVAPFSKVAGDRARFVGVNRINLERRGFPAERIAVIKHAFHLLFQSRLLFEEACLRVEEECRSSKDVAHLLAFLRSAERGFVR
ncbi:MAG: acyl-ACP--UDP-N-acetylglucosamine O-acyltransferase [Myxococcota bacterium]